MVEEVELSGLQILSLLFADEVVLLALLNSDLQLSLGRFAANCEPVGMRITNSKSETIILSWKMVDCLFPIEGELLPSVEEFKYLRVCS